MIKGATTVSDALRSLSNTDAITADEAVGALKESGNAIGGRAISDLRESWHRFDQQKPPPSLWILFTRDEDYDSALEGQYNNSGMVCYGDYLNFYERATSFMYWRIMSDNEIDDMADGRGEGEQ